MGWTVEPVEQAVLFHYSEDPCVSRFEPHVPRTNPGVAAAVWAIDAARAPLYWFPRDCPRVTVWANTAAQRRHLRHLFGTDCTRVQAAPSSWSDEIGACKLYEYRFEAADFGPWPEAEGQWISYRAVTPADVVPVGDLLERHREVNIDLRLVPSLGAIRETVLESGLPFSIVRYRD